MPLFVQKIVVKYHFRFAQYFVWFCTDDKENYRFFQKIRHMDYPRRKYMRPCGDNNNRRGFFKRIYSAGKALAVYDGHVLCRFCAHLCV